MTSTKDFKEKSNIRFYDEEDAADLKKIDFNENALL